MNLSSNDEVNHVDDGTNISDHTGGQGSATVATASTCPIHEDGIAIFESSSNRFNTLMVDDNISLELGEAARDKSMHAESEGFATIHQQQVVWDGNISSDGFILVSMGMERTDIPLLVTHQFKLYGIDLSNQQTLSKESNESLRI